MKILSLMAFLLSLILFSFNSATSVAAEEAQQSASHQEAAIEAMGTVREIPMWNLSGQGVYIQPVERWGKPTDDPVWLIYFNHSEQSFTQPESVCPRTAGDIATWTGTSIADWHSVQEGPYTNWVFSSPSPKVVKVYFGRFQYSAEYELHLVGDGLMGFSVVTQNGTFRCLKATNPNIPVRPLGPITTTPPSTHTPQSMIDEVKEWCVSNCSSLVVEQLVESNGYVNPKGAVVSSKDPSKCPVFNIPDNVSWDASDSGRGPVQNKKLCAASIRRE